MASMPLSVDVVIRQQTECPQANLACQLRSSAIASVILLDGIRSHLIGLVDPDDVIAWTKRTILIVDACIAILNDLPDLADSAESIPGPHLKDNILTLYLWLSQAKSTYPAAGGIAEDLQQVLARLNSKTAQ